MTGKFSRRLSGRGRAFGIKFRPGVFHLFQRYRMHEAAEQIAEGRAGDMRDLALRLGYFAQTHFIRDFKATSDGLRVSIAPPPRRRQGELCAAWGPSRQNRGRCGC
jgi:hypothetical protein